MSFKYASTKTFGMTLTKSSFSPDKNQYLHDVLNYLFACGSLRTTDRFARCNADLSGLFRVFLSLLLFFPWASLLLTSFRTIISFSLPFFFLFLFLFYGEGGL